MITITPLKDNVTQNLERIEEPIVRIEKRMTACVMDLNEAYHAMWGLPDAAIEEIVNTMGLPWFEGLLTEHSIRAEMFNAILASRGISNPQAVTGLPREFVVDEQGVFSLTKPHVNETT